MAESTYVTTEVFFATIKGILTAFQESVTNAHVLRLALTSARALPIPAGYLNQLNAHVRQSPAFLAMAESIARIPASGPPDTIEEILKKFEGPIQ